MIRRQGAIFLLCALACLCAAAPAEAGLRLCNRTSYVLYASTGVEAGDAVTTQGWMRIVPGSCTAAIAGALTAKDYFVYARSSQAHRGPAHAWGGHTKFCAKDTDYALKLPFAAQQCPSDGAFPMPFARVDTGGSPNWTTTFTQTPPLASANAARQAGIARLLADAGYRVGLDEGGVAVALERFRTRMRLASNAGLTDLFDALETEAMKVASPAGYSICNDTGGPIWAALGMRRESTWVAQGWWKVMPGACARAITAKLSTDKIYLLAERTHNHHLVSGKADFCVTNITFEVEGREHCAERGLTAAGFAATDVKGRAGFTAHVGEDGLLLPASSGPVQTSSPK